MLFESGSLPQAGKKFHLFQVGLLFPHLLNLTPPEQGQWAKLSDTCNSQKLFADLYLDSGLRLNLTQVWYKLTTDRNLIIAIEHNDKYGTIGNSKVTNTDLNSDYVYFRTYTNAYWTTPRWLAAQAAYGSTIAEPIHVEGVTAATVPQILALQLSYQQYTTMPGAVFAYRNGYLVNDISLVTCTAGDTIEFVYDASVVRTVQIPLNTLKVFDSTVDLAGKYLIHTPGHDSTTIHYQDDVDFAVVNASTNQGVYLHKNTRNTCRMLTHCDYSLNVQSVQNAISQSSALYQSQLDQTAIRYYVRASGFERALVLEASRIQELYKLSDSAIINAMVGTEATAPVWKAENLEASAYAQLMAASYAQITDGLSRDALGYNAVAKLFAEPIKAVQTVGLNKYCDVPSLYATGQHTVFEYDSAGLLLGWYVIQNQPIYTATNSTCQLVEFVKGLCNQTLSDDLNQLSTTLAADADWRAYARLKSSNPQANQWVDVTGDAEFYILNGQTLTWNNAARLTYDTLVRQNSSALLLQTSLTPTDGLMVFHLTTWRTVNGVAGLYDLDIPMGELDVYLNGRSLVRGLDYRLDFPVVYIHNKDYLNATSNNNVVIRMKGLCQANKSLQDRPESGFVVSGMLSADHQYQVRQDKVVSVIVGGGMHLASDFVYSEQSPSPNGASPLNGWPYEIKDIVVPLKSITGIDTYAYRGQSVSVDAQVGEYLTSRYPTLNPTPVAAATKPKLYSMFFAKLISDLANGNFDSTRLLSNYTNAQVTTWLQPYQYLLQNDPIRLGSRPDLSMVQLDMQHHNNVVTLTLYTYQFLQRVCQMIAPDVFTDTVLNTNVTYPIV